MPLQKVFVLKEEICIDEKIITCTNISLSLQKWLWRTHVKKQWNKKQVETKKKKPKLQKPAGLWIVIAWYMVKLVFYN